MANHIHLYSGYIKAASRRYGIPVGVLERVILTESGGNPTAKSPMGALGLMQLMPGTARGLGVENPLDPRENIMGGAKYLRDQINHFGSLKKALAAYNAGPGAVVKYGGVPPYAETQAYVRKILGGLPNVGAAPQESPPALAASAGLGARAPTRQAGPNFMQIAQNFAQSAVPQGTDMPQLLGQPGDDSVSAHYQQMMQQAPNPDEWKQFLPQPQIAGQHLPQQPELLPDVQHFGVHPALSGNIPMVTGNAKHAAELYPNIAFASHVDWQHVNPRLLAAINAEAKKLHMKATVISGYRSNKYSQKVGGFAGDPHSRGIAVDAYIGGHPIGEVVPPDVWQKLGIRSGNTPGFYKGKTDPEHLDLVGLPHKSRKRR